MSPIETAASQEDSGSTVQGELCRRLWPWPARAVAVLTGFVLLRAAWTLLTRFGLGLRRQASARIAAGVMTVDERWLILGKVVRTHRTVAPVTGLRDARLENRTGYASLVAGFGFLMVGLWFGVHWILDGLGAGYPQLFLVGGLAVAVGAAADIALYLFIPGGPGHSRLRLGLGRYELRLAGIEKDRAAQFLDSLSREWSAAHSPCHR